jgi:7-carboxy-7-deazaguanine synthase
VVITGGEPFRQEIEFLVLTLVAAGFYVQVETNGTLPPPKLSFINKNPSERKGLYVVVSPKAGGVHPHTAEAACAFKYVMGSHSVDHSDGLPTYALDHTLGSGLRVARPPKSFAGPIYLQPMDEQDADLNEAHLRSCIHSCMKYGYVLQLQVHKIIRME